jgi:hypothetical protein
LIQQASWEYAPLLDLTARLHADYARRHGMTFLAVRGRVLDEGEYVAFDKLALMRQAMDERFIYVFWIDADAAIVGDEDLRGALGAFHETPLRETPLRETPLRETPLRMEIGMARHPGPPEHYNVGVILARNTDRARAFLDEALARRPGPLPWHEQQVINDLAGEPRFAGCVRRLDDKWNSTVNANEVEDPVVMAWHGVGGVMERGMWMRALLVR